MSRESVEPRSVNVAARVSYAEGLSRYRPAPPPPAEKRGWTDDEELRFAVWLWAMAQPLLGMHKRQAATFAEQFDLFTNERPVGPTGMIWGEAYSQPRTVTLVYDEDEHVSQVAVERIWPN
jgi:hypothetical protein